MPPIWRPGWSREFGFSPELGPIGYAPEGSSGNPFAGRPYAEETQRSIDREVARLLREAESRATPAPA